MALSSKVSHSLLGSVFAIPNQPCAGCGVMTVIRSECSHPDTAFSLAAAEHGRRGVHVPMCRACFDKPSRVAVVVREMVKGGVWR